MAVTLQATQSGSASTSIHAQSGDTLTFALNETVESSVLDRAVLAGDAITNISGVIFAFNNGGGASHALGITQSGSGSTVIDGQSGDTVTLKLAETVESSVLDGVVDELNACLFPITKITIAFDNTGNAS